MSRSGSLSVLHRLKDHLINRSSRSDFMLTILLVILLLALIGAWPAWPYSTGWGYYPSGGLGLLLLILIVVLLARRRPVV